MILIISDNIDYRLVRFDYWHGFREGFQPIGRSTSPAWGSRSSNYTVYFDVYYDGLQS